MRIQCQGKGEKVFRKRKHICIKFSFQSPYEKGNLKEERKALLWLLCLGWTNLCKAPEWASGPTPATQSVHRAGERLTGACMWLPWQRDPAKPASWGLWLPVSNMHWFSPLGKCCWVLTVCSLQAPWGQGSGLIYTSLYLPTWDASAQHNIVPQ